MAPEEEKTPDFGRKLIGIRTALVAYAVLAILACLSLKGYALVVALIVVGGAAAKTYVQYLRERME